MDKEKRSLVRHSSGNDQDYTIFDAILEILKKKNQKESACDRLLSYICSPWNVVSLFLVFFGLAILVWISEIIWTDITFYGKDLVLILFGSRSGENIGLGIDVRIVHYLLVGFNLLAWSLVIRFAKK